MKTKTTKFAPKDKMPATAKCRSVGLGSVRGEFADAMPAKQDKTCPTCGGTGKC